MPTQAQIERMNGLQAEARRAEEQRSARRFSEWVRNLSYRQMSTSTQGQPTPPVPPTTAESAPEWVWSYDPTTTITFSVGEEMSPSTPPEMVFDDDGSLENVD